MSYMEVRISCDTNIITLGESVNIQCSFLNPVCFEDDEENSYGTKFINRGGSMSTLIGYTPDTVGEHTVYFKTSNGYQSNSLVFTVEEEISNDVVSDIVIDKSGNFDIRTLEDSVDVQFHIPDNFVIGDSDETMILIMNNVSDVFITCNQLGWNKIHSSEGKVSDIDLRTVVGEERIINFTFEKNDEAPTGNPVFLLSLLDNIYNEPITAKLTFYFEEDTSGGTTPTEPDDPINENPSTEEDFDNYIYINVQVNYGAKRIANVPVILVHSINDNQYEGTSDENGECIIKIGGNTLGELLVDYLVEVDCTDYGTNTNMFKATSDNNELLLYLVKLDDCQNQILTNKNCKYFHHEPYMTPNNFDLYFDHSKIPSNIIQESAHNLLKRLQRTLPLTKILHLNLQSEQDTHLNGININSSVKLRFDERIITVSEASLKIYGVWKNYGESESKANLKYNYFYANDTSIPIVGATVKLINKDYPLISYSAITNDNGSASFQVPYGSYYHYIVKNNQHWLFESVLQINQNNFSLNQINGQNVIVPNEDMGNVDVSEFQVDVVKNKGTSNEVVVESVVLNATNNYIASTRELPVFDGENNKIDYDLNFVRSYCDVFIEDEDLIGVIKHEEVLL